MASFGYSAGDFLAAANLAFKICMVLRDLKGVFKTYQNVLSDLDLTTQALNYAGRLQNVDNISLDAKNAISHGLSCCQRDLQKLMGLVQKYKPGLTSMFQKCKWAYLDSEQVKSLRDNILKSVFQINLILSVTGLEVMTCNEATLRKFGVDLKVNTSKLQQIQEAIPNELGLPFSSDHKPLLLEDALGRRIPFPYEFAVQREKFHEILKICFKDLPGSKWVNASQYTIKTQSYDLLTSEAWCSNIRPNMVLIMSIIVTKRGRRIDMSCPSCDTPYTGYSTNKELEQVQCQGCFTWYCVTVKPRIVDLEGPESRDNSALVECAHDSGKGRQTALAPNDIDEEVRRFKRLDVMLDVDEGGLNEQASGLRDLEIQAILEILGREY